MFERDKQNELLFVDDAEVLLYHKMRAQIAWGIFPRVKIS